MFKCNDCGQKLMTIPIINKKNKEDIQIGIRPCSTCITTIATKMAENAKHNMLHRLNDMADKTAEEIKTEIHHKLIHNITTTIGLVKVEGGKIPITVLGEDVT
jgi:hypothetical protein